MIWWTNQLVKLNQTSKDFYSMSQKIIKLTESQLRDIVTKVINEQLSKPNDVVVENSTIKV